MQLTNDLKGKIEGAKNEEEVKSIIENTKKNVEAAGVILDDADLDGAAGGIATPQKRPNQENWNQ